jgi:MacB-like periplasmic core domain
VGQRSDQPVLVTLQAGPRATRSELSADGLTYFADVQRTADSVPGVTGTAWVARPPGSRPARQSFRVERPESGVRDVVLDVVSFTSASLAAVTVPPMEGRMFGGGDTPHSCRVAVVNEDAARDVFDGNAVGQSLEDPAGKRVEIVGVVAARAQSPTKTMSRPMIYYYAAQGEPPKGREGPAPFRVRESTHMTRVMLDANVVSANYFDAVGLQRIDGSFLAAAPTPAGCRTGVVDQAAADLYFDGDAVGGAVIDDAGRRTIIIGVVQSSLLRHWQRHPDPTIYFPMWQDFTPRMTLFVATPDASEDMVAALATRLAAVEGGTGEVRVTTLDAHMTRVALAPERISAVLVVAAAALAFVLGTLGVYGVMAESARQRRREIALRIALGAQRARVIRQVLVEGLRLGGAGAAAGMVGAFIAFPWLAGGTHQSVLDDPGPWLNGPLALMAVVAIASLLPTRRALSVDPLAILRDV